MSPGFPEAPLRDTLPMCHSPLRHGLRQATHNTLGFGGTWSPIYSETGLPQGQVPGCPPPADVPDSHSSLREKYTWYEEEENTDSVCPSFECSVKVKYIWTEKNYSHSLAALAKCENALVWAHVHCHCDRHRHCSAYVNTEMQKCFLII
jgi:hypothetical protein